MNNMHYVGLDVHKKTISYCLRQSDGTIVREGTIAQLGKHWRACWKAFLNRGWLDWKPRCSVLGSTIIFAHKGVR